MFSFLKSERSKLKEAGKNWLYLASKVYHFRKDKLTENEVSTLLQLSEELKVSMRSKAEESRLRSSIEALKEHLESVGGAYYPRGGMAENVEFFLAAIIIYVGVTSFFVKPFKIPTNSMWPTYYGMTGEVYSDPEEAPGGLSQLFRLVAFGAKRFEVKAPEDGEVLVPMIQRGGVYDVFRKPATVKRYFLINAPGKEYSLYVGNSRTSFKLPADFTFEKQVLGPLHEAGVKTPYDSLPMRISPQRDIADKVTEMVFDARIGKEVPVTVYLVRTGIKVKTDDTLLSFDLMTGDQLFVDRMSYHFVSPKVGDGFVFKTGEIADIPDDVFYIKRLAGTPGDRVKIDGTKLMVNGEPASGSDAFDWNANQEGLYAGYTAFPSGPTELDLSREITIPEGKYLALGDNSHNSFDGRGWGFVPEGSVVGRPIMIYYPFTKRFGLAK